MSFEFKKDSKVVKTNIPGLSVFDLPVHGDDRGWFKENWRRTKMVELGLPDFGSVQNSISYNDKKGVIRSIDAEPWDISTSRLRLVRFRRVGGPAPKREFRLGVSLSVLIRRVPSSTVGSGQQLPGVAGRHGVCVSGECALVAGAEEGVRVRQHGGSGSRH